MARARFGRGSGCYPCGVCKRQTRDVGDNGGVELCPQCYELAGIENALSDAPESYPENPSEERRAVWARYKEEINDHLAALKRNGIDAEKVWADLLRYQPEPVVIAREPLLSRSLLQAERNMRAEEYHNLLIRANLMIAEAGSKFKVGRVSTHDGINLSRLAVDIAALAAVLESLDRCINSAE